MASGFGGGSDDQDRLLDEATAVVKEQAFYMKRAMDNDNLREALKHASNLICELRTSLLSPKNYYELYMQVFQEMQHLSTFFNDKSRHNRKMMDLYESVQHAGNILPRMYLLATVGASYIKSKEAPAKEILKDMSELTKGVQHPIRGLFLRYYLSQMVKDKLPDTGTEYEEAGGGDINDAFDFILTNFMESNRLWVRIQHQGPQKDKQQREKQRHDLRVLVGANLVRLSQLEGMTMEFYKDMALPKLLEHILSVKDTMSQQYLFESMIQVFPDEFHIGTLEQELAAYTKAQPSVDMKPVMKALMDRLSAFLAEHKDEDHALQGVDIFSLFQVHLKAILERTLEPAASGAPAPPPDPLVPALELQSAFMQFTLNLFAEVHHVDIILQSTADLVNKYFDRQSDNSRKLSANAEDKVVDLLSHLLKVMPGQCLDMEHCVSLVNTLQYGNRKKVALSMVNSINDGDTLKLDSVDTVAKLMKFIEPLLVDEEGGGKDDSVDAADQEKVAKLTYKIDGVNDHTPELDTIMEILTKMRGFFGKGTEKRIIYTLPPLVYYSLSLIEKKQAETEENKSAVTAKKIFQFAHKTITALNEHLPMVAIQLWLVGAAVSDKLVAGGEQGFKAMTDEFVSKAWEVFDEKAAETTEIRACLLQLMGTIGTLQHYDAENYANDAEKIVKHANKITKKATKIELLSAAASLFAKADTEEYAYQNEGTCLQVAQKVLKLVDAQVESDAKDVGLWIDMLDLYIYFFPKFPAQFTMEFISKIRQLCGEHTEYAKNDDDSRASAEKAINHLKHTKAYCQTLKKQDSNTYCFPEEFFA